MSTKASKTIDDLGFSTYSLYEQNKRLLDQEMLSQSREMGPQMTVDVFEPILVSEHYLLFDLDLRGSPWGSMSPPMHYGDQKRRLFTYQLGPKFGPEEFIEMQMSRIEGKKEEEVGKWAESGLKQDAEGIRGVKEIEKEAKILTEAMQEINVINKLIEHINCERYRFNRG